ncbi:MAG: 1-deoxy-D-xylulose-5-phosphate reductoisomerase [Alphaproteobacteria bacterium RIFCSPLOWO2_01_FULL_40_26]|nr:MAG: 1-deoxy-D-xylulose-5-phosphate reductoisomerase [Alphaproteobacteria bacterium RIFCSPHIGHO2_01_FULL_40_8]OFW94846.1 MAG: 1-deoxy-D-xylulose-5-phosphate reductoisomerase [Alphaproteobacteria bacterium RIFCSPLOWO2_01_FULL_40_26]OFX10472.1 MAG: 1-deoxy-D-xylulose-5-phosphate reductoisomerase [Alphaproteobacteria bacterium RIFCSPLOWO2_02_FULL_40_19]OFX11046.1 MAG: 1-deoxy-D-xylulose-5-phosphate reductoisomerase [Alphaproteobacteria bacterium RIFCSPLOWO2_12_FULL_40_11]
MKKKISIFGSTGSIGKNTIEVIKNSPDDFEIIALVAKNDVKTLISQALLFKPRYVVIENEKHFPKLKSSLKNCEILCGWEAILEVAKIKCDLFVAAIVGFAGMLPTLNAIKAGSNIALANKESLVCAGKFLMDEAKKHKVKIIPVDSEHNAIFQIFENENLAMIDDIVLTASGGPFFNSKKDFRKISVAEALKHPNWKMGAKISIDSATMMNKGLEMIEAFHLFPLKKNQIKILTHPQSIVHGMVNYLDGSSLAMISLPDMKVPISYALTFPNRMKIRHQKLDLAKLQKLEFFAVDEKKFPAVRICREALEIDGSAPTVLNAANEIAVAKFLDGEITFDCISKIVEKTLNKISHKKLSSVEEVIFFDEKARACLQTHHSSIFQKF